MSASNEHRRRRAFEENPLSLSISHEAFEEWLEDEAAPIGSASQGEKRRSRLAGQGSRFQQGVNAPRGITWEDLCREPLPWTSDFFVFSQHVSTSFSIPRSIGEAQQRLDRNLRQYLGNYMRVIGFIFLFVLYRKPMALGGLVLGLKGGQVLRQQSADMSIDKASWKYRVSRFVLHTSIWVVLFYCRVPMVLTIAAGLSILAVCLHGITRKI